MRSAKTVDNRIYSELGSRWYEAHDDPVALLRAEARLRGPWVAAEIARNVGSRPCAVLDIGCGAGFLSNHLGAVGHRVTGVDLASESLVIAAEHDESKTVRYECCDARQLPYADGSFDVVCAMDFLEHVADPERVIAEAARVLAPSGLFFFHTFDRNWFSWLVVIKGVEWFVRNTPKDMHVLHLFLRPSEVQAMCRRNELEPVQLVGTRPRVNRAFLAMLRSGVVPEEFEFEFCRSTRLGYSGLARKSHRGADR